ncbi:MAG: ABC transporter permease [Clostridiales bacterium]|jgi:putative ABC transport system permease protein|nr:ABC transporter permease [Clostridiales bacterium]
MFYKLAFKNVTKSIKDYAVYFLTLTFGVCVFYVFNSVDSQQAVLEMSAAQNAMLEAMMQIMGIISVFISFILAFLILYANKFMMRRRKKELGTYMLLGMPKGKISIILMAETAVIGIISLAVGLLVGVFLSQGLAVVTAKLFEVQIRNFQFVFSPQAFGKTILYFFIIFVVVMLFNSLIVSRCKLISLINADRQNERLRVKKLWVSVVIFLISAACLGAAYYLITKNGMMYIDSEFFMSLILGTIGTFLFFMSLSGFLLRVLKTSKRIYLRNLNMFVLRQINSKINTTYFSMTFICIMLLLAIGILSVGGGFQTYFSNDIDGYTPYDISMQCYEDNYDMENALEAQMNTDLGELFESRHQFLIYNTGLSTGDVADLYPGLLEINEYSRPLYAVGVSDFNRLLAMMGKEPIMVLENQYAISSVNDGNYQSVLDGLLNEGLGLKIAGREYAPSQTAMIPLPVSNSAMSIFTLILPDDQVKKLEVAERTYNAQYKGDKLQVEKLVMSALEDEGGNIIVDEGPAVMVTTRISTVEMATGLKATILFVAIYMGIIFLIASAAVLALQQLSEASDNAIRYKLLGKLGVERRMLNHAIYAQVAIYFFIPLALAIVHSIVGLNAITHTLAMQGAAADSSSMMLSAVALAVIYGGYFLATCLGCKSIAKGKNV